MHEKFGISEIHAGADAVFHFAVRAVNLVVFLGELRNIPKRHVGFEADGGGRVRVEQRVADHQPVFFRREHNLLGENNATHAVNGFGNTVAVKLADVFMPFGAVVVSVVFVDSQIEFGSVLNNGFVDGREDQMVVIVQKRHGHNQQPLVFGCVATRDRCVLIGAFPVSSQYVAI